jgi:hypothetical protein
MRPQSSRSLEPTLATRRGVISGFAGLLITLAGGSVASAASPSAQGPTSTQSGAQGFRFIDGQTGQVRISTGPIGLAGWARGIGAKAVAGTGNPPASPSTGAVPSYPCNCPPGCSYAYTYCFCAPNSSCGQRVSCADVYSCDRCDCSTYSYAGPVYCLNNENCY